MTKRTAQEFAEAIKNLGVTELAIRDCSICRYPLKYLFVGNDVFYDAGCWCVMDGPRIDPRSHQDLADFYNNQTSQSVIENLDKTFGFTALETTA